MLVHGKLFVSHFYLIKMLIVKSSRITYLYINFKRHFWAGDDIYIGNRVAVVITHIFWAAAFYLFIWAHQVYGLWIVTLYYTAPLLVFMSWLVVTTFLHHQDIDAPWYGDAAWTYVKVFFSSSSLFILF